MRRHQVGIVIGARSGRCRSRAPAARRPRHCRSDAGRGETRRRDMRVGSGFPHRGLDRRRTFVRQVANATAADIASGHDTPPTRGARPRARWSDLPAAEPSSPRSHRAPRHADSLRRASRRARRSGFAAYRGRRRWRAVRRDSDSWQHKRDTALGRSTRRNRTQATARSAVESTRSAPAGMSSAPNRPRLSPRSLNAMALAKMRPSTSGSTTCMARSRGLSPRVDASQLARDMPACATCKIGQSDIERYACIVIRGCRGKRGGVEMMSGGYAESAARRNAADR